MNWYVDIDGEQYGPFADRVNALRCVERRIDMSPIDRFNLETARKTSVYDEYGRHDIEIYQA